MSRYAELFADLATKNEGAFVPFVTLGDPTPELSLQIIEALVAGGADALELGIPFSDPVADGPTIQDATTRALNAGTTPDTCFEILEQVRAKYPKLQIGLLLYANLVYAKASMASISAPSPPESIRCWSPTCRLRCPPLTRVPPIRSVSPPSLSRHPMAMKPRCRRWPS